MKERRLDDVYTQSEIFDETSPIVESSSQKAMAQKGIDDYHFLVEKMGLMSRLYRWRLVWDLRDLGQMIIGKQIEINLCFPKKNSERTSAYFEIPIHLKIDNQWNNMPIPTKDLSKEELRRHLSFAMRYPKEYSHYKTRYTQNLGCPAGCGASSDRLN